MNRITPIEEPYPISRGPIQTLIECVRYTLASLPDVSRIRLQRQVWAMIHRSVATIDNHMLDSKRQKLRKTLMRTDKTASIIPTYRDDTEEISCHDSIQSYRNADATAFDSAIVVTPVIQIGLSYTHNQLHARHGMDLLTHSCRFPSPHGTNSLG